MKLQLDTSDQMSYNMWVINGALMQSTEEFVESIVIDICSRSFLLLSDQGDEKIVECDSADEFMAILDVVTANLNDDQIEYAAVTVTN